MAALVHTPECIDTINLFINFVLHLQVRTVPSVAALLHTNVGCRACKLHVLPFLEKRRMWAVIPGEVSASQTVTKYEETEAEYGDV